MEERRGVVAAVGFVVCLFVLVQLGALALVEPFEAAGHQVVEDTDDPTNSVVYLGLILVVTGFMLAAFRYDADAVIRGVVIVVSGVLAWYVFAELLPPVLVVGSFDLLAAGAAAGVSLALLVYPEWYVIDAAGVVIGAGAAGLFGISFGLLPALVLLSALAIYDAISVYKTKHMLSLAEGVMDLKVPVVLVVPTTLSYSFLDADPPASLNDEESGMDESDEIHQTAEGAREDAPAVDTLADDAPAGDTVDAARTGETPVDDAPAGDTPANSAPADDAGERTEAESDPERDAFFVGLGDAVIPAVLVASAAFFIDGNALDVPGLALNVPALGAMVGTVAGLLVLMAMVLKGRAHAGLPLLNGGAIAGYLLAALASGVSLATALGL